MKKKLVLLIISILFVITSLIFYITSMEVYNDDGWKGISVDRDYLIILLSSIVVLVMTILNFKDNIKFRKEIQTSGYFCLLINCIYGLYGIIKVLSKGVEEIYEGNSFTIDINTLIIYIVWFIASVITSSILIFIKKKRSLA